MSNNIASLYGLNYKIGLRGYVFVFINGDWIRSTMEKHFVEAALSGDNVKINPCRMRNKKEGRYNVK